MNWTIQTVGDGSIAVLEGVQGVICDLPSALDVIAATAFERGCHKLAIEKEALAGFFLTSAPDWRAKCWRSLSSTGCRWPSGEIIRGVPERP